MIRLYSFALAALLVLPGFATAQIASFDGTYRSAPVSGNGCPLFTPVLRVQSGTVTMRLNPSITFEGQVGRDGSLDLPHGQARLSGNFSAGKFDGSVNGARCQYPLALAK